ncbi:hypothetical protein AGMMS50276_08410 [Synergistales bacterium]|nr:hypothetical protein AGMMS50276_08410 [Synergistales bacterium]
MQTMTNHKTHITLIALIMASVASLFFLVAEVTALFLIAYVFTLIGIAAFWRGNMYLADNIKSYPWAAAFPVSILQYLAAEVVFSVVFVLSEQLSIFRLSPTWFFLIHAIFLAFFLVRLIMLKSGHEIIDQRDSEIQEKIQTLSFLLADLSAVLEKTPENAKDIQPVIDAIRYSDPMSHPSLAPFENDIKDSVVSLEQAAEQNDGEKISALCVTLLRQIKERNNRVRLMK